MRVVIDTSSLLSLVRYYLPFDKSGLLFKYIQDKILAKEILVIDKVVDESKFVSKGLIVEKLDYLLIKKNQTKTDAILPPKAFFNMAENQFANSVNKKRLEPVEFENRKNVFLQSADAKLILLALREKKGLDADLIVITEETKASNDNKAFKKLPAICEILGIECWTLPKLLEEFDGIDFEVK